MDFDDAIKAHSAWKKRLAAYLAKPDGSITPTELLIENRCLLGQWIDGDGAKWRHEPEYKALREAHRTFHRAAADLVQRADRGEQTTQAVALGADSELSKASVAMVTAIMTLRRRAA